MRRNLALIGLLAWLAAPAAFAQDPETLDQGDADDAEPVIVETDQLEDDDNEVDVQGETDEETVQVIEADSETTDEANDGADSETTDEANDGEAATPVFSLEEYQRLNAEMEQIDIERMTAASGSDDYRDATVRALEIRSAMVRYITQWMSNGMPEEYRAMATQTRSLLSQHLVRLNVELGRCDDASGAAYLIREMASSEDPEVRSAYEATMADLDACEEAEDAADATVVIADEPVEPVVVSVDENIVIDDTSSDSGVRRGRRTTGIVLTSVGVAALAGGFAIDASNASARSDFDDLSADCSPSSPCSFETQDELESLQDDIQNARVPTGVLIGVGAASTITGVILWATSGGGGAEQRRVQVADGPGLVGTGLRIRF